MLLPRRQFLLLLVFFAVSLAGCDDDEMRVVSDDNPIGVSPTIIRLEPSQAVYQVGEPVEIEIVVDRSRDVGSIVFHLSYDPQVLTFVPPAVEGPFMASDGADTVFLSGEIQGKGEIVVGASRIGSPDGVGGTGTLAVFEFNTIASGDCGFRFTGATVKDPQARSLPAAFTTAAVRVE